MCVIVFILIMVFASRRCGGNAQPMLYSSRLSKSDRALNLVHNAHSTKDESEKLIRSTLAQNEMTIILFYAPWCPHCHKAKPLVEQAAQTFDFPFLLVNCDNCHRESIQNEFVTVEYFPYLVKYDRASHSCREIDGAITMEGIKAFIEALEPAQAPARE